MESKKLSYGIFSATITESKKQQIYEEYEEYWTEKQEAERARLQKAKNKKNSNYSVPVKYILIFPQNREKKISVASSF